MEIIYLPYSPWQWLVTAIASLAVLLLIARFVWPGSRAMVFGERLILAWGALICSLLSAGLLVLAAWNPTLARQIRSPKSHLIVVLDVSKSITSAPGGWPTIQKATVSFLADAVSYLPEEMRTNGIASLVLVGKQVNVYKERFDITELSSAFLRLTERDFPDDSESDLAAGLARASKLLGSGGGQGVVVLVTDGNQTVGDALAAAQQLAYSGVPIHILPVEGWSSAVYLAAIDLPTQVEVGQETFLRGLVWNRLATQEVVDLRITKNAGYDHPDDPFAQQVIGELRGAVLEHNAYRSLREPLVFRKAGIQWVYVTLETGSPKTQVERRLFTNVIGPPRLLAVGGDNRWAGQFSASDFQVDTANAADLPATTHFADYDAIVLHWVFASQFQPGVLAALAKAVQEDGVGLFFANGGHVPLEEEAPTVITSYKGTPLEPLLPVSVEPRPFTKDPPARQVVVLMDVSGSMAGDKVEIAKAIAAHIIRTLLRPIDHLDLVLFTTGANHLVIDQVMTPQGKQNALAKISSIQAGGGTEPSQALQVIAARKLVNCGLIFLSDGEFGPVSERPECRTTIFDIGQDWVDPNFPLNLADPIPVGSGFNLSGLKIPFFEPEPRNKFFEFGAFTPLRATSLSIDTSALTIPQGLTLNGSAVSYVKPEADLIAVRPKLVDPILAYMAAGEGMVGVLTGELSAEWLANQTSRQGAKDWLLQTVAFYARNRYYIQIADLGNAAELCISVYLPSNQVPQLDNLSAGLSWPGESAVVVMERDVVDNATFCGLARLPAKGEPRKGFLKITESGLDALGRAQRIPMLFPSASSAISALTQEDYSAGVNHPLLQQLASVGGGEFLPASDLVLFRPQIDFPTSRAAWPWLLVSGLFFYLAAIACRRMNY